MRYRLLADGSTVPVESTGTVVEFTVWVTLACGIALLVMGVKGDQRWLRFWGGLTILCCVVYFLRGPLGLSLPG